MYWPDPGPLYRGIEGGREQGPGEDWPALWAAIRAMDPAPSMVVIDPASAALDGVSMNEGGPVRAFMGALASEATAAGCGVLVVAHDTKAARNAARDGDDPGAGAVAGSATWFDAPCGVLYRKRRLDAWHAVPSVIRSDVSSILLEPRSPPLVRHMRHFYEPQCRALDAAQEHPREPSVRELSDRHKAFVEALVANGGNQTAAALAAGYGAESAARGGRAASVAGCRLLKRENIRQAVGEAKPSARRKALMAAVRANAARRLRELREARVKLAGKLAPAAAVRGPQSEAARMVRRLRGEPVLRMPGHCRCGDKVTAGAATCAPCRRRHRDYRRASRARERLIWQWHPRRAARPVNHRRMRA